MTFQDGGVRVATGTRHMVRLFDDADSLVNTVGEYLLEGWQAGDTLLVVVRPEHWTRVAQMLAMNGCCVDEAAASGQLVVRDAAATLAAFMANRPIPERFARTLGPLLETLLARGAPVRIYGEMVDILAAQADLVSACELERLWNALGARYAFTLLCGYSSGHFGDPRTAGMLRQICDTHDDASAKPEDLLGSWLIAGRQSRFHTDTETR